MKKTKVLNGGDGDGVAARNMAERPRHGGIRINDDHSSSDGICRRKTSEEVSRELLLKEAGFEEQGNVHLTSKHRVWLEDANAVWGDHRIFFNTKSNIQTILNKNGTSIVAVLVGNTKSGKLHVSKENHWERLSTTQLGPGLDWIGRKSWDVRCPERDLIEVAKTGKLPANRRVMGALAALQSKISSNLNGWDDQ